MKDKKKKKSSFSPAMMVFKYLAGLVVSSVAVTGVGFVDSVIWKVAIFVASTLATTIVGGMYSSKLIKTKIAGGEAKLIIFALLLYICYLIINLVAQFAGTMPLWAFIVIFIVFVLVIASLAIYVYKIQKEKSLALYYTEQDEVEERERQEEIERECERSRRLGKNRVVDLTKDKTVCFTLNELWEQSEKNAALKVLSTKKSIEYAIINSGTNEDGKFYGIVKYLNYENEVECEIMFANKKIWYI